VIMIVPIPPIPSVLAIAFSHAVRGPALLMSKRYLLRLVAYSSTFHTVIESLGELAAMEGRNWTSARLGSAT
jgi:hypothetical protein